MLKVKCEIINKIDVYVLQKTEYTHRNYVRKFQGRKGRTKMIK
jgi:hypothetical protein